MEEIITPSPFRTISMGLGTLSKAFHGPVLTITYMDVWDCAEAGMPVYINCILIHVS